MIGSDSDNGDESGNEEVMSSAEENGSDEGPRDSSEEEGQYDWGFLMTGTPTEETGVSDLAKLCNVGKSIESLQNDDQDRAADMDAGLGDAAGPGGGGGAESGNAGGGNAGGGNAGVRNVGGGSDRSSGGTWSFEIAQRDTEAVRREAAMMSYPLMEEYDFHADANNPRLSSTLRHTTKVRPYQEKSLRRMFGNGRARSGIVVLPCGAGKTLTGVTAASTIGRSCVVLCTSGTAVKQWKEQFHLWTTVADDSVFCFTSSTKLKKDDPWMVPRKACVLITTYSMMSVNKRSDASEAIVSTIRSREWGLMILDEVHVVPANTFRRVLSVCKAHCKLGLTATLVREDDLITDLNFLIGPKLYEANWMDLTQAGHLANVQCVEVWCGMTKEFFREYEGWSGGGSTTANHGRRR